MEGRPYYALRDGDREVVPFDVALDCAAEMCFHGTCSVRDAAAMTNVSKSAIDRAVIALRQAVEESSRADDKSREMWVVAFDVKNTALPAYIESLLARQIQEDIDKNVHLGTLLQLRQYVNHFLLMNSLHVDGFHDPDGLPSAGWAERFMHRHGFYFDSTRPIELHRMFLTEEVLKNYWRCVRLALRLADGHPSRIYTVDETPFEHGLRGTDKVCYTYTMILFSSPILPTEKECRMSSLTFPWGRFLSGFIYTMSFCLPRLSCRFPSRFLAFLQVISHEGDRCREPVAQRHPKSTNVIVGVNAAGNHLPYMFIVTSSAVPELQQDELTIMWSSDVFPDDMSECWAYPTVGGGTTKEAFVAWVEKVFLPNVVGFPGTKVLFLDNLSSHITLLALKLLVDSHVIPVLYPCNSLSGFS